MSGLAVEIVTPERRVTRVTAQEVIAPGSDGLFGVRPGHARLYSLLAMGRLSVRSEDGERAYFVSGGFVEVNEGGVRVLADLAEPVESIDIAAAQKKVEELTAKLDELSPMTPEAAKLRHEVEQHRGRISAATAR